MRELTTAEGKKVTNRCRYCGGEILFMQVETSDGDVILTPTDIPYHYDEKWPIYWFTFKCKQCLGEFKLRCKL